MPPDEHETPRPEQSASPDLGECPVCGAPIVAGTPADTPCPECGHGLLFRCELDGDAVIVRLASEKMLTGESVERFGRALDGLAERSEALVIDFDDVDFVSSSVIAKLIKLKRSPQAQGRRVALRGLHSDLLELFRITRLDQFFEIL